MSDLFAGPVERVCIGCEKAILINMVKEIKQAMFRLSTEVFGERQAAQVFFTEAERSIKFLQSFLLMTRAGR